MSEEPKKPGRKPGSPKTGGKKKTLSPDAIPRTYIATPPQHEVLKSTLQELREKDSK